MREGTRPYEVVRSERHQIGRIAVIRDTIVINGNEHAYTYVDFRDSVCVLPVYEGRVIAIEQYRHALDSWELELPCGGIEPGETPEAAGRRELLEETGFVAGEMVYLGKYYTNQGYSSAACSVFFTKCTARGPASRDETELIRTHEIPVARFDRMTATNRFRLLIGLEAWNRAKLFALV